MFGQILSAVGAALGLVCAIYAIFQEGNVKKGVMIIGATIVVLVFVYIKPICSFIETTIENVWPVTYEEYVQRCENSWKKLNYEAAEKAAKKSKDAVLISKAEQLSAAQTLAIEIAKQIDADDDSAVFELVMTGAYKQIYNMGNTIGNSGKICFKIKNNVMLAIYESGIYYGPFKHEQNNFLRSGRGLWFYVTGEQEDTRRNKFSVEWVNDVPQGYCEKTISAWVTLSEVQSDNTTIDVGNCWTFAYMKGNVQNGLWDGKATLEREGDPTVYLFDFVEGLPQYSKSYKMTNGQIMYKIDYAQGLYDTADVTTPQGIPPLAAPGRPTKAP